MKRVMAILGLALLAAFVWIAPTMATATEPLALQGQYVVDDTSSKVLGSDVSKLDQQVQDFAAEHGVQLFVVYVDTFTSPSEPGLWGAETATKNFLDDDAILLSIAVEDRLYDLNASVALVSDSEYDTLTDEFVRPALKSSDWGGVVGATLDGIEKILVNPATGGSGAVLAVVSGVVVVGGGVAAGVVISRKRKRNAAEQEAVASLKDLEAEASSLLVHVDDALRSSVQELGFAEAQFGKEAAAPFGVAISEARAQLDAAFLLRQKLDDNVPDTDEQRRDWLSEIIARCSGAKESLDAHAESFTRLREMEHRIPEVVEQLSMDLPVVQASLEPAQQTAITLAAAFAPTVVAQLAPNLEEAATRLKFVAECLASASEEYAAGEKSVAAVTLRAGEAALDQARTLIGSPEALASELAEASHQLEAAVADLRGDLQVVASLSGAITDETRQALQQATQQVEAVLANNAQGDPAATLHAAAAANVQIDAAIGAAREQAERTRRAEAARDEALIPARAEVLAAEQFIETRRGAVGAQARTRLAEARRQLQLADQYAQADPTASYQAAQQASQYARAAHQLAANDVSGWGGGSIGGSSSGSNDSFGGAVLGGILGALLNGGSGSSSSGRSGGGWSGSNGGFTGGWGGGGSSGGGSRGGSRGGSSGGSRGGGRRGGGGRF